ncbi:MAG: TrkH family potassium uptake protein, partial [Bacilli bacterium]
SISNIGPGLSMVGPLGNYSIFSNFSKIILSIVMLTGRLELFPILILFSPSLYKNN